MNERKRTKCKRREGIGLCDECSQPNWPQGYVGYGMMICLECLHNNYVAKIPISLDAKKPARITSY